MKYEKLLTSLALYDISFIVIGSHALNLLDKKFNLDIKVNLEEKDFDIIVQFNHQFLKFVEDFQISKVNKRVKNFTIYKIYGNEPKNIDLIVRSNFIHMKIDNELIPYLDYDNFKKYSYIDQIYEHKINCINLEAYYGIIESTGLAKYKSITNQILTKYPDLKHRVLT